MQILTFRLKNLYYGISTDYIIEMTDAITSTHVPGSPAWIQGLIHLRGQVLTLVNPYSLLKIDVENTEDCYNNTVICEINNHKMAMMVDEVLSVIDIEESQLQELGDNLDSTVKGFFNIDQKMITLLDVNRLFEE